MKDGRVLLAEDHPLMQKMIVTLLSQTFDLVEVVERGDRIFEAVEESRPDAVVLDISLPGRGGLQVLAGLRRLLPSLAIVVLTTHADPLYRAEAICRGADGYILKASAFTDLLPALQSALADRRSTVSAVRQTA